MIANVYIGNIATATGTADVITASYVPAPTVLADKMILYFRATAANATTTPTFSPNGLTAHTIVKQGGTALAAGDIPAVGAVMEIVYDEANTRWELLNPKGIGTFEPFVASYTTVQIAALTGMTLRQRVFNTTDNDYEWYDGTRWVKEAHPKYKVYTALLNQASNNAPVATVRENNLGGTLVWSYDSTGQYLGTLASAFSSTDKVVIFMGTTGGIGILNAYVNDANSIYVRTLSGDPFDFADAILVNTSIEIRVYY